MKAIEICQEVVALLEAWGYKPEVKVNKPAVGYIDICFPVKNGFETMPTRHKDAISMLAKGYLSEFYYVSDTQHVYLRHECNGLEPNATCKFKRASFWKWTGSICQHGRPL